MGWQDAPLSSTPDNPNGRLGRPGDPPAQASDTTPAGAPKWKSAALAKSDAGPKWKQAPLKTDDQPGRGSYEENLKDEGVDPGVGEALASVAGSTVGYAAGIENAFFRGGGKSREENLRLFKQGQEATQVEPKTATGKALVKAASIPAIPLNYVADRVKQGIKKVGGDELTQEVVGGAVPYVAPVVAGKAVVAAARAAKKGIDLIPTKIQKELGKTDYTRFSKRIVDTDETVNRLNSVAGEGVGKIGLTEAQYHAAGYEATSKKGSKNLYQGQEALDKEADLIDKRSHPVNQRYEDNARAVYDHLMQLTERKATPGIDRMLTEAEESLVNRLKRTMQRDETMERASPRNQITKVDRKAWQQAIEDAYAQKTISPGRKDAFNKRIYDLHKIVRASRTGKIILAGDAKLSATAKSRLGERFSNVIKRHWPAAAAGFIAGGVHGAVLGVAAHALGSKAHAALTAGSLLKDTVTGRKATSRALNARAAATAKKATNKAIAEKVAQGTSPKEATRGEDIVPVILAGNTRELRDQLRRINPSHRWEELTTREKAILQNNLAREFQQAAKEKPHAIAHIDSDGFHVVATPNGYTKAKVRGGESMQVTWTETNAAARGKGENKQRLNYLIKVAKEMGLKRVTSDGYVSAKAARAWEALGAPRNPHSHLETDQEGEQHWSSGDTRPIFSIELEPTKH